MLWSRKYPVVEAWWLDRRIEFLGEVDMRTLGDPRQPKGAYLCRRLLERPEVPRVIDRSVLAALQPSDGEPGAPVAVTWADLLGASGPGSRQG